MGSAGTAAGPATPRWRKLLERACLAAGLLLLAVYGIGMAHRNAGAAAGLARFDAVGDAGTAAVEQELKVDFSLWSPRRIRDYWQSVARLKDDPIAVISIQRLGLRAPVFPGTDELTLNRGAGWINGTARPGEPGNCGIAGHRDGFFRALKDVAAGDVIAIRTPGVLSTFRVDGIEIVSPADVAVLNARGGAELTLVTCFPFYFVGDAPRRFIVHAVREKREPVVSVRQGGPASEPAAGIHNQGANQ